MLLQFSSVQLLSRVWLFVTPWITARQASLSIANSRSLLKLMSIESVMPSSHLKACSKRTQVKKITTKTIPFLSNKFWHHDLPHIYSRRCSSALENPLRIYVYVYVCVCGCVGVCVCVYEVVSHSITAASLWPLGL